MLWLSLGVMILFSVDVRWKVMMDWLGWLGMMLKLWLFVFLFVVIGGL